MTLSLDRMLVLLRRGLGNLDSDDLGLVDATELLNMGLWELEDKFPFRAKESELRFPLVVDQFEYTLPTTLDAISSLAVLDAFEQRHKLGRASRAWMDENFDEDSDKGTPTRYLREDTTLILHPIPDAILTMILTSKLSIESLTDGTVEATGLPRNWDELVVEGAIVRGHFYSGDYNESRMAANFQVQKVRSAVQSLAKEEKADSRYARLNVIWAEPEGR